MMRCCCCLGDGIQPCLRDYDRLQSIAVVLIYIQIGCALIGSLGALYNGVLLINLAIALFALVAIESSSQSLGRTYAVLLFSAILLDVCWFILFSYEVWTISSNDYGIYFILSVRLVLAMQIIGFAVRLSSSFLWIQIYRLGISHVDSGVPREADFDVRTSFLSPSPAAPRRTPEADDVLGGSIYDPAYYSSLFEDGLENGFSNRLILRAAVFGEYSFKYFLAENSQVSSSGDDSSSAAAEASRIKDSLGKFFQSADVENPSSPVSNECSSMSKQQSV